MATSAALLVGVLVPAGVAASSNVSYFNYKGLYVCGAAGFQFAPHHSYSHGKVGTGALTGHVVTGHYKRYRTKITGVSGFLKKHHESLRIQRADLVMVNRKAHVTHIKCRKYASSTYSLPSMGAGPSPSIFGIDTGTYDTNSSNYTKDVPAAEALDSHWDHFVLSPTTATGDFSSSDYWVTQARSHGMGVVLSFGGIQSACSIKPTPSNLAGCPPTTASDLSAYQTYIENILTRYHNVVAYYDSWVEPNQGGQWAGNADPTQYATLLKAEYQAFQTFNAEHPNSGPGGSNMQLLFGSSNGFTVIPPNDNLNSPPNQAGTIAALPFVHQTLDDLGTDKPFDGVALQAYRYPADKGPGALVYDWVGNLTYPQDGCPQHSGGFCQMTWTDELSAYESEFTSHGDGQPPMWLTEFGWPGGSNANSNCQIASDQDYCVSDETQGTYLREAYRDLESLPFVQGALWFNLRDYAAGASTRDPWFFFYYGLLQYDYTQKSAGTDFKELAAGT